MMHEAKLSISGEEPNGDALPLTWTRITALLAKVHPIWWLAAGFVLMCCAYEYGRVMNLRPLGHHLSRQTSCLSITYNIYRGEATLWEPAVHNYLSDGHTNGKSAGECPWLYGLIAMIWKLTGPSEFVYRLVMLVLHFAGTSALFLGLRKLIDHPWWAAFGALLFFASPMMAYFAIAFLPDVPSFDLSLIGCWLLFRTWPAQQGWQVVLAGVIFALAGLLKITSLMAPLALCAWLLFEHTFGRSVQGSKKLFPTPWLALGTFILVLAITYIWYAHSDAYNNLHGGAYSYQGTWAVWDLPPDVVQRSWELGRTILVFQVFDTSAWLVLVGMAAYLIFNLQKVPRVLGWITLILAGGTVLYILLWWVTLDSHDYYYINPLITLVALLCTFLVTLKRAHPAVFNSKWSIALFGLLLAYNVLYTANNHEMRTRGDGPLLATDVLPLYHGDAELRYWDLNQRWVSRYFVDIEAYDRSLGITEDDLVIQVDDRSVCASLYLMRQRGWVQFGSSFGSAAEIDDLISKGASYLFVVTKEWLEEPHMQPYYRYKMGQYHNVRVFDLRPFQGPDHKVPKPWGRGPLPTTVTNGIE
jgi:hypothetical protein